MRQVMKYTLDSDPEYGELDQALALINGIAQHMNEEVRSHESRRLLIQLGPPNSPTSPSPI